MRFIWLRASKHTLNCLIGCSIGDFAMLFFLQNYYPDLPVMLTMVFAMTAGLITSVLFEATILRTKEQFAWPAAFEMALSMSFISIAWNGDHREHHRLPLTGGVVNPGTAWFWIALGISLTAGFLAPLPYNYHKLRKHGKACH